MKQVSIIIPIYNEHGSLEELYQRLATTCDQKLASYACQLLFINDGSSDGSRTLLDQLAQRDPRVGVIHFIRNFGQHPALSAGMQAATGDYIVLIDGDLQNPPEEIPKLINALEQGYDIAYGYRKKRNDSLLRKCGSWFMNRLLGYIFSMSIPDVGSAFRGMSRRVVDEFNKLREQSRLSMLLMASFGFKSIAVETVHAPRAAGQSNYPAWKAIKMTLELIISFSPRIVRLITYCGFLMLGVTALLTLQAGARLLLWGMTSSLLVLMMTAMLMFFGITFVFLGLMSEYLLKIFMNIQGRPFFIIDEQRGLFVCQPGQSAGRRKQSVRAAKRAR